MTNQYTREQILGMSNEELNKLVAIHIMNWQIYHYDKDIKERCYYMLVDENFDPVANDEPRSLTEGERKTEEEAWKDNKDWSGDISAAWEVLKTLREEHDLKIVIEPKNHIGYYMHVKNDMGGIVISPHEFDNESEGIARVAMLALLYLP